MSKCAWIEVKPGNQFWCKNANKWVDRHTFDTYCSTYPDKCGYNTGGGCYLTTACVGAMGLPDNCHELETLRSFRDGYIMNEVDCGENVIKDYYSTAPQIVENVNSLENHEEIWKALYENEIVPCVELINQNEYQKAYEKYSSMTKMLGEKYLNN